MSAVEAGVSFGFAAGLVLALAEMVGATLFGYGAWLPVRFAASVILGIGPLYEQVPGFALLVFAFTAHALLTVLHGVVFCFITRKTGLSYRMSPGALALVGLLFGVWTWIFDLQILGRTSFPWFLETNQLLQLAAHAFFFGAPLGLFFGLWERAEVRARLVRPGATRATV